MEPNLGPLKKTGATVLSRALEIKGGNVPPEGARFILDLGMGQDRDGLRRLVDERLDDGLPLRLVQVARFAGLGYAL